jgi:pyruvate/2-oxoglutarate dehydrogenase complex dihydrolipoamide dehydrogenase (E3) component
LITPSSTYDLIVIGGGASGSTIASGAVEAGLSVAMIEEWKVGGTCLNAGCDPTKTMVRAAEVLHLIRNAGVHGVDAGNPRLDWPALRARVDGVIDEIRGGDGPANVRAQGIDLYETHGRFISEYELQAGNAVLAGERIVIATGQTTDVAPIEGIEQTGYLTNVEAVALEALPSSMAIVGGGVIAVEFAQMFARLGCEVTLIGSQEYVLPKEDEDIRAALTDILADDGIRLEMSARATKALRTADGHVRLTCEREDGETFQVVAAEVLLATGRKPNTDRLGLDAAGVRHGDKGIPVNARLQTNVSHIFAVGDVTGIYPFTHVADYQARIVVHNLLNDASPHGADYRVVPWAIFTDPEVARVGLTEEEARAGGYSVVTATHAFEDMPRAITSDNRAGFVKLVVDRATHQVLGGHILGAHAGELVTQVSLVMQHRLPVSAIANTIHPYPTMSEAIFWAADALVTGPLAGTIPVPSR